MTDEKKKHTKSDKYDLKVLISVWGQAEAEVLKGFLENSGIPCFFKSQSVQSVYPFTMDGLGEIKIYVKEPDLEAAKKLLADL
jgi:hypothetical protein